MSLEDHTPCHQEASDACKDQDKTASIKKIPEKKRRFNVAGEHVSVRISGTGRVYMTGFTDDRLRYHIISKAYLNKSKKESINALCHALKKGMVPRQIHLDNGRQFTAKEFRKELAKHHICIHIL